MHVLQVVEEHKNIQQAVESYLKKNGAEREYKHFVEKRIQNVKETKPGTLRSENFSEKEKKRDREKNVKKAAVR